MKNITYVSPITDRIANDPELLAMAFHDAEREWRLGPVKTFAQHKKWTGYTASVELVECQMVTEPRRTEEEAADGKIATYPAVVVTGTVEQKA